MRDNISIYTKIKLNNGVDMPIFGFGTFRAKSGSETRDAVLYALEAGYRLIDTAKIYGNEADVGEALNKSSIPREKLFVTTKLWNTDHGYDTALSACEESLKQLGVSYLDLYLIHWPVKDLRLDTWRALETLLKDGKCRAIGVSNYMKWHLKELLENSVIIPAINQVEFSPYLYQKDLLEFCCSHGIQLEAYSPLTKGQKLSDPGLVSIAKRYSKTPAQVLICWCLQHDIIVITKSAKKERIIENAGVFDFSISSEDMSILDSFNEDLRTGWDPSTVV